jgi:hypothetical protein
LGSAGTAHVISQSTFNGNLPTDIPQDLTFFNTIAATVVVPDGARYLFVGVGDSFSSDNADPNLNFAVRVNEAVVPAIPEPSTWLLLLAGLASTVAVRWRTGAAISETRLRVRGA